jgi:hypothetical protein
VGDCESADLRRLVLQLCALVHNAAGRRHLLRGCTSIGCTTIRCIWHSNRMHDSDVSNNRGDNGGSPHRLWAGTEAPFR